MSKTGTKPRRLKVHLWPTWDRDIKTRLRPQVHNMPEYRLHAQHFSLNTSYYIILRYSKSQNSPSLSSYCKTFAVFYTTLCTWSATDVDFYSVSLCPSRKHFFVLLVFLSHYIISSPCTCFKVTFKWKLQRQTFEFHDIDTDLVKIIDTVLNVY